MPAYLMVMGPLIIGGHGRGGSGGLGGLSMLQPAAAERAPVVAFKHPTTPLMHLPRKG